MTLERLDEIATAWRRGLDADELTNPAGPLYTNGLYTEYDITATGSPKQSVVNTIETHVVPPPPMCLCCIV